MKMLVLVILFQAFIIQTLTATSVPLWKTQLIHHNLWKGDIGNGHWKYPSMLEVHSVQVEEYGSALVTFSAHDINLDMCGKSSNNKTVIFYEDSTWDKSSHFEGQTNLKISGEFLKDGINYYFSGNVSSDEDQTYAVVWLSPAGYPVEIIKETNTHLRYGLAIGIPVGLGVVLIVSAALIMWWAVKKGYVRHIPMAYKSFTNPKRSAAVYKLETDHGDGQTPSVHI
ncbi:unnamed protein product [Lymnaea stagnalis]|uniref:Uncharacterized protein n=1 Tax=Lymnaea stagnalis TaxID=6523 RepID=A0AAV2IDC6_LYMST